MLVQRLISLMRVKWLQAASRSSSSSSTSSSTSSSSRASSTSVQRRECDGWKLMCARLYWIWFRLFKMFSFLRKDSSYVALKVEDYMFIVDMVGRGAMCWWASVSVSQSVRQSVSQSVTRSLTHAHTRARTHARIHSLNHSCTHSLIRSFVHSRIHSVTKGRIDSVRGGLRLGHCGATLGPDIVRQFYYNWTICVKVTYLIFWSNRFGFNPRPGIDWVDGFDVFFERWGLNLCEMGDRIYI